MNKAAPYMKHASPELQNSFKTSLGLLAQEQQMGLKKQELEQDSAFKIGSQELQKIGLSNQERQIANQEEATRQNAQLQNAKLAYDKDELEFKNKVFLDESNQRIKNLELERIKEQQNQKKEENKEWRERTKLNISAMKDIDKLFDRSDNEEKQNIIDLISNGYTDNFGVNHKVSPENIPAAVKLLDNNSVIFFDTSKPTHTKILLDSGYLIPQPK
jgi:hypothetical protein